MIVEKIPAQTSIRIGNQGSHHHAVATNERHVDKFAPYCFGIEHEERWHDGDATIGFFHAEAALRWEALTAYPVEWNFDEEVATEAEVYFRPTDIPYLVYLLRRPPT